MWFENFTSQFVYCREDLEEINVLVYILGSHVVKRDMVIAELPESQCCCPSSREAGERLEVEGAG